MLASGTHAARGEAAPVIGWIELKPSAERKDQVTIVGHVYGLSRSSGRFALSVQRAGTSGVAKTGQSGTFEVAPGQDTVLSQTAIDIAPSAAITIELRLLIDDVEVFSVVMKPRATSGARQL